MARADGLLAVGGDLSVVRLLAGYRHGVFPWYDVGEPILWWSPDPRLVLEPDQLKVARSLRSVIRKRTYSITFDTAFRAVIHACAGTPRSDQPGTWIHPEVEAAYAALHDLGYAHSVEAWKPARLSAACMVSCSALLLWRVDVLDPEGRLESRTRRARPSC